MPTPSIGPERKKLLEAYVACCKRAARRVEVAWHISNGAHYSPANTLASSYRVRHMLKAIRARGIEPYATARGRLLEAQSRFGLELANAK